MSSLVDPSDQHETVGLAERAEEIKLWTRQTLALDEESIVSVSEFACTKPTCPNQRTVIMVISQEGPARQISIHKSIENVREFDVLDACLDLLRNSPA
jgi:hypothetical protein